MKALEKKSTANQRTKEWTCKDNRAYVDSERTGYKCLANM